MSRRILERPVVSAKPIPLLETDVQRAIMLAAPAHVRLFRNQVGTYMLPDGRVVSSGMGKSTSDLVGWRSEVITAAMVGERIARFIVCEVKRHGFRIDERARKQQHFIDVVMEAGGAGVMASSVEEARVLFD